MKKDERKFEDVVRSIASSEEDVDKILKAARLERHEKPRMSEETLKDILFGVAFLIGIAMYFGFMLLAFH